MRATESVTPSGRRIGRYILLDEIASGGMASVHVGRLLGPEGFSRTVAIKRLHPHLARDHEFAAMFLDEARLASRVRHPNAVPILDVVSDAGEVYLVMDYVAGDSLARLGRLQRRRGDPVPPHIVSALMCDVLLGLDAAHEATGPGGTPLGLVHRDVSPQNILVGSDGVARIADFGIAKAASLSRSTERGQLKGKLAYMAPEQLQRRVVDRRTDVFAVGIVTWELLTGGRLYAENDEAAVVAKILTHRCEPPSKLAAVSAALDGVVLTALSPDPNLRFATARQMALELERAEPRAHALAVAAWVEQLAGAQLQARADRIQQLETGADVLGRGRSESETKSGVTDVSVSANARQAPPRQRLLLFVVPAMLVAAAAFAVLSVRAPPEISSLRTGLRSAAFAASPGAASDVPSQTPAQKPKTNELETSTKTKLPVRSKPKSAACKPPYDIDARGTKRFKPECFR